jgi:3-isopropylmalate dehydrogenase
MRALIALLPGDGVGPEVTAQAVRVLTGVAEQWGHEFELREGLMGGSAIDATGAALPNETLALALAADAVLLGAVGGPRWSDPKAKIRPEEGLLALRKALGVYANLRPVAVHPAVASASPLKADRLAGVDIMFVRELTGGIYFGEKTREAFPGGERATDLCVYTSDEIARVVRVAARLARQRRRLLTSVDKANVLETSRLWRRVTETVVREEFPDVRLEHMLVDACAMKLIQSPAAFDVVVTENMFGDILTDEASVIAGSIGLLPSASLGDGTRGLYEPIHGSAPDIAGRGLANPIGTIMSVAMLLRHSLRLEAEARAVEDAVNTVLSGGWGTQDIAPEGRHRCSTTELGHLIVSALFRPSADQTTDRPTASIDVARVG